MNIYKLTSGKTSGSFQLPLRGILVARKVDNESILKEIQYVPGASSIYKEDHKGDAKSKSLWFDDGEIRVSLDDKLLNDLLQSHPWFKSKFILVNEEETAKEKVSTFEKSAKAANSILNEKDDDRLVAMAMILISLDASAWNPFKCKAELLEYAKNHSDTLLNAMDKPDYESRFLAALAFNKKIVKYNQFQTAVLWGDESAGLIVRVAEGENGIDKLGEFLSKQSESSTTTLQRIGEKVDDILIDSTSKSVTLDKSIEDIKAEGIEEYKATLATSKTEAEIRAEIQAEFEIKYSRVNANANDTKIVSDDAAVDMEALKAEYKEVTGKEVSPRFYNDPEWIKAKIAETKNT